MRWQRTKEPYRIFKRIWLNINYRTASPKAEKNKFYKDKGPVGYKDYSEFFLLEYGKFITAFNDNPDVSIDRIDDRLGYIPGNVQFISFEENRKKANNRKKL